MEKGFDFETADHMTRKVEVAAVGPPRPVQKERKVSPVILPFSARHSRIHGTIAHPQNIGSEVSGLR